MEDQARNPSIRSTISKTRSHDNRVAESLAELTPDSSGYRDLRKALMQYREYAARGSWPTVPADIKLKPGQMSDHVPAIARRLAASGDYTGAVPVDGQPAAYTRICRKR